MREITFLNFYYDTKENMQELHSNSSNTKLKHPWVKQPIVYMQEHSYTHTVWPLDWSRQILFINKNYAVVLKGLIWAGFNNYY